ncbi:hypothetical protein DRR49_25370, partial [Escherichia coli]|nr:hypothetical protein [Escherichia coli]
KHTRNSVLPDMKKGIQPMKPEYLHRLTGRDVLRYRRKNFDLMTGLAVATALGLIITFILLVARTTV